MRKGVLIAIVVFGVFSADIALTRSPTQQPPVAVFSNGQVEISPDFMDYLIEVKGFGWSDEVFKTVRYNFPEIQECARDFLREGPEKTRKVKEKKLEEYRKKWALEAQEEENKENNYFLSVTGRDFLNLFDKMAEDGRTTKGDEQSKYLSLLEKKLLKKGEIYKMEKDYRTFCCEKNFLHSSRSETAISVVKKRLKQYKLLNNEEFLSSSAAPVVQQILIREFPCVQE